MGGGFWNKNDFVKYSRTRGRRVTLDGRIDISMVRDAREMYTNGNLAEELDPKNYPPGDYFGLVIQGDSMEPKISEGDVVIVRQQEDVESGQIAIVTVNGDDATCKKVMKYGSHLRLVSFNPKYEPMQFTEEEVNSLPVKILGRVVELRAKF